MIKKSSNNKLTSITLNNYAYILCWGDTGHSDKKITRKYNLLDYASPNIILALVSNTTKNI